MQPFEEMQITAANSRVLHFDADLIYLEVVHGMIFKTDLARFGDNGHRIGLHFLLSLFDTIKKGAQGSHCNFDFFTGLERWLGNQLTME